MTVTQDLSILSLITNASVLVQLVMALLLVVSFMSWLFIFRKLFRHPAGGDPDREIRARLLERQRHERLYQSAVNDRHRAGSLERIFEAGFREFAKLRAQRGADPSIPVEGARRAMRATYQREMDNLERHLSFLASVGSVSPYVGLFGTVWGIMNSFRGLANVNSGDAGACRPRHRRGADRHRHRPVRRDPGGGRL